MRTPPVHKGASGYKATEAFDMKHLKPQWGLALALAVMGVSSWAAPVGGTVAAGKATISQNNGQTLIQQSSAKAILDWKQFNIGAQEVVKFAQPNRNSVTLNRIQGGSPSRIDGQLLANGQVFLVNPQGVLFGRNASVDVGGLVATTLNMDAADFLSGKYIWRGNGNGIIGNEGLIRSDNGYVALLGAQVKNSGQIMANKGSVALATGQEMTLDISGDGLLNVVVLKGVADALIANSGLIQADGGQVLLTTHAAQTAVNSVVNNTGVLRAQTLTKRNGKIILLADMTSGTAQVSGSLDASAPNGGNGGFIETSGAKVRIDPLARITTLAPKGQTGKWLVDPQDYTVAASGGDQTGQQLSISLENTNVELQTTAGFKAGNGDIHINDNVSWKANTTLTLTASNDVNVNAPITAQGDSAGLVINANAAHGKEAASGKGVFNLSNAEITLSGKSPQLTFANNDINIQNGKVNLTGESPKLKIAGEDYVVITKLGEEGSVTGKDLQGINGNLGVNYALGSDIDAKATADWSATGGFKPIGKVTMAMLNNNYYCSYFCTVSDEKVIFNQKIQGFGHSINQIYLKINEVDTPVGIFQALGTKSAVGNLKIKDFSMQLKSYNYFISNTYSSTGIGSLTGFNAGSVFNSAATGAIALNLSTKNNNNCTQSLSNCYIYSSDYTIGGLAGYSSGNIINSSSQVQINFVDSFTANTPHHQVNIGGLIGVNNGIIKQSYTKGEITFSTAGDSLSRVVTVSIGGLVGESNSNSGVIKSYSTGKINFNCEYCTNPNWINSENAIGGLVGGVFYGLQGISGSYSTSDVTSVSPVANTNTGGLVGNAYYTAISDSYANGKISGPGSVGGIVGILNGSTVSKSIFTGEAQSSTQLSTGSIAGNCVTNCSVSASYYISSPASSQLTAIGGFRKAWTDISTAADVNSIATVSAYKLVAAELKKQTNYTGATSANGQINPAWDFNKTWFMYEGQTAPLLRAFMTPLTITANSVVKTYDGSNYQATTGVSYSQTPDSRLLGSTNFSGSAIGAKNVGTYGIQASGQYSEQLGYLIHYVDGSLNINPANLAVAGMSANNKTYDRSTSASINTNQATLSGVITGDSVSLSIGNGVGTFADKNVGNGKLVSVTGLSLTGADAVNYSLSQPTLSANINLASLSLLGISANNKTYDRNTSASINTSLASLSGVITGDSVSLSASNVYGVFADSSVGNAKNVLIYGLGISGADASNYSLIQPVSVANITAEVKASSLQETYLSVSQDIPQTWNSENVISTASVSPLQRSKRPMTMPDGFGSFRAPALVQLVGEGIKTSLD